MRMTSSSAGMVAPPGSVADQVLQQPVGKILEVVHPLAQVGVGHLAHPRVDVVVDLLHRRLGGQAGVDRLADPPQPTHVLRDHPVGLEHVAVLAVAADRGRAQHVVQRPVHVGDRLAQALVLDAGILGDDLADGEARLVQDGDAEGEAAVQAGAFEPRRRRRHRLGGEEVRAVDGDAARHHLGEDHRHRLQRLDFLVRILALSGVLHRQHADDAAAAQDRHAHQRVIGLLSGFRAEGEVGMDLAIRQGERTLLGRDLADEALAHPEPGAPHGGGAQALGREQLQHVAGAADVDGADLRRHVLGDDRDDPRQPGIAIAVAGHDVADARQQAPQNQDGLAVVHHLIQPPAGRAQRAPRRPDRPARR